MSDYYIEIKYEVTEVRHTGYCPDVEDPSDVLLSYIERQRRRKIPTPNSYRDVAIRVERSTIMA